MDRMRTNQGGSVLSFVIIGAIVGLLLIGGVYVARQQTAQPEPLPPQTPIQKPETKKPSESKKQEKETTPSHSSTPQSSSPQTAPQPNPPSTNNLPQTGSAENIGSLLILATLSATVISYTRSRRPRLSL